MPDAENENMFDMQQLSNYVDHNHGADQTANDVESNT